MPIFATIAGYLCTKITIRTRTDVYETLCPQQMLVHKGGKIKKLGRGVQRWGQDGCERRIKICENKKKKKNCFYFFFLGGGGSGRGGGEGVGLGGQGSRVDVYREVKFL